MSVKKHGGKYCCLPGCTSSSYSPNISLLVVPNGKSNRRYGVHTNMVEWSENFLKILYKYRDPLDKGFGKRCKAGLAYICSNHFEIDDIRSTQKRTWLNFGALPTKNLPQKSVPTKTLSERRIIVKNELVSKSSDKVLKPLSDIQKDIKSLKTKWEFRLVLDHMQNASSNRDASPKIHLTLWNFFKCRFRSIPNCSVFIYENLSFIIYISGLPLPRDHSLYNMCLNDVSIGDLLSNIEHYKLCDGYRDVESKSWIPVLFEDFADSSHSKLLVRYFSPKCSIAVKKDTTHCPGCLHKFMLSTLSAERKDSLKSTPVLRTNNCSAATAKYTAMTGNKRMAELEKELATVGANPNESVKAVIESVISNCDMKQHSFLKEWWATQHINAEVPERRRRYPPSVVKYCLRLYSKSPAAYQSLREVLVLPSPGTLRIERNREGKVHAGIQGDLLQRLKSVLAQTQDQHERMAVLIIDEMTIKDDLVYRPYSNDVIGYVDAGDEALNATMTGEKKIADHMLAIYVRGITNRQLDGVIAYYPTSNLRALQLNCILYNAVIDMELKTNILIYGIIGDGLSTNVAVFNAWSQDEDDGVKYRTIHPLDDSRYIYFIQDPPHLLKTVRNNLINPKKHLWNKSRFSWHIIKDLIEEDLLLGDLRFFPRLSAKHASPSSYEKMKVSIAAQTLSATVALELERAGHKDFANFVMLIDRWFDMMNTSYYHAQRRAKPDMIPFQANDEQSTERLKWLKEDFIRYFQTWKSTVRDTPLASSEAERRAMVLSKCTENGLIMSTKAMVDLVNDTLAAGAKFVMTRRINQDPLESHFGHQRQRGKRVDAPTVSMFAYNVRGINCFRSVTGANVSHSGEV